MKKTFSQKIARFFEIADYFLLIPATFGLFMSLAAFELFLVISVIYGLGCVLLYGFIKHSRGGLSRKACTWLWGGTMVYNLTHALFWVTIASYQTRMNAALWILSFSSWGLVVFVLSSLALRQDLSRLDE